MMSLDAQGDYFRLLTNGSYTIQVLHPAYQPQVQYVRIENRPKQIEAQRIDFILDRIPLSAVLRQILFRVSPS
jgi:hypothetical protein